MISIEDLCVSNGRFRLEGIGLDVPTGAYGVLMGKTGCGKTTILEAVCGLKRPERGAIRLMGRDVTRIKAAERGIGYVPQDRSLFQTMTVADNIGFAARIRHWPRGRINQRVDELAELLGLTHLLTRMPGGLSGGEAQRVALGRALAAAPGILCLDEPLSNLDYDTRLEMCDLLKTVQEHTGVTTIHVTHDRDQVRRLADTLFQYGLNAQVKIDLLAVGLLVAGGVVGAVIGSSIASALPAATLRKMFAVVMIVVAVKMLVTPSRGAKKEQPSEPTTATEKTTADP